jgi:hypothetical protein
MILAFTICSNNYLAQAIVLGTSWLRYHPDAQFAIVLVDEPCDEIDYECDERFVVIPLKTLPLDNLAELVRRYNITELNTAIKADAFMHLAEVYKPEKLLYIDPDIQVYSRFDEVLCLLDAYDLVVTPHYCTPIDDGKSTADVNMIGIGLFNLGFLATARPEKLRPFFHWWRDRLYRYCYYNSNRGLFYDQIWANFIVVFFDSWYVLKHPGYNVANWNFHERRLTHVGGDEHLVNETFPLRFFHFSGYKLDHPDVIAGYHNRYTFATRPDLLPVFNRYRGACTAAGAERLSQIPCVYYEQHKKMKSEADALAWKKLPFRAKLRKTVVGVLRKMFW